MPSVRTPGEKGEEDFSLVSEHSFRKDQKEKEEVEANTSGSSFMPELVACFHLHEHIGPQRSQGSTYQYSL